MDSKICIRDSVFSLNMLCFRLCNLKIVDYYIRIIMKMIILCSLEVDATLTLRLSFSLNESVTMIDHVLLRSWAKQVRVTSLTLILKPRPKQ